MDEDRLSGVYYFVGTDGNKPVKEFIYSLPLKEQTKVYAYIRELKREGNRLHRSMADYLRDGIYELRPKSNRIFYFFYLRDSAVLVHAIKKKTEKIPENDLRLCIKRKIEAEEESGHIEKLELGGDLNEKS
ncbi:MAG: type II toxin-antitoxin system RelE/ParE family toxin [Candidatus Omnitrophica bacterium]|nr:type II toxin-antitoxin system RelE/ParE family toxin [Candidatus Omnitrophota bacterium]